MNDNTYRNKPFNEAFREATAAQEREAKLQAQVTLALKNRDEFEALYERAEADNAKLRSVVERLRDGLERISLHGCTCARVAGEILESANKPIEGGGA